jgi:alanine racemase
LAVLTVDEAAELRQAAVAAPILVLGGVRDSEEADRALSLRVTPVLHHAEALYCASSAARRSGARTPVHVEVDTGMRRAGVPVDAAVEFLQAVADDPNLQLEGAMTHFARADEPDLGPSLEQIRQFRGVLEEASARGLGLSVVHVENSAALLAGKTLSDAIPEANAVRVGLMLYGVRPAPHLGAHLEPVMTLQARVSDVHDVAAGEGVGYGATFRSAKATRVATLPLGYADGVSWSAGGRGEVWLAGARLPIVGRVSMDSICVEIGDAPVEIGDLAVFFGRSRDGGIPVEEAAAAAGTIAYELLVRVGRRVPREAVE